MAKKILINLGLVIIGILMFALAQPGIFIPEGCPILAYFVFIPVFLLSYRITLKSAWLYGLIYGIGAYCLFAYWLASFHPMGIAVISFLYGLQLLVVFMLLRLCIVFFPKKGWLVQWLLWSGYEYAKTLGFAGFSYGVTAYSQWQVPLIIQCADITGVWGISCFIVFASAWLSKIINDTKDTLLINKSDSKNTFWKLLYVSINNHKVSGIIWLVFLVGILCYGQFSQKDYSNTQTLDIALIQQNTDPWKGGLASYKRDLRTLEKLSDQAMEENPSLDLIVWPETAFVPRITWHYKQRNEPQKFDLVNDLLTFIDNKDVSFVIGNDHAEEGYLNGKYGAVDYNSVLYFTPKKNVFPPEPEVYKKIHLVPFTEYFPFDKLFPKIYELLLNGDTHMWEPGTEHVIFSVKDFNFATPICFEDTFGYLGRNFVNNGADFFVNLSNDAWSKSLSCQYQHLSMATFRCVENRVSMVRSTASGQTAIINGNGKVLAMAEPFAETYLVGKVPVEKKSTKTIYTRYGDYFGLILLISAIIVLIIGGIWHVRFNKK